MHWFEFSSGSYVNLEQATIINCGGGHIDVTSSDEPVLHLSDPARIEALRERMRRLSELADYEVSEWAQTDRPTAADTGDLAANDGTPAPVRIDEDVARA